MYLGSFSYMPFIFESFSPSRYSPVTRQTFAYGYPAVTDEIPQYQIFSTSQFAPGFPAIPNHSWPHERGHGYMDGPQSVSGLVGTSSPPGVNGPAGHAGPAGPPRAKGDRGPAGIQGIQGVPGTSGDFGLQPPPVPPGSSSALLALCDCRYPKFVHGVSLAAF